MCIRKPAHKEWIYGRSTSFLLRSCWNDVLYTFQNQHLLMLLLELLDLVSVSCFSCRVVLHEFSSHCCKFCSMLSLHILHVLLMRLFFSPKISTRLQIFCLSGCTHFFEFSFHLFQIWFLTYFSTSLFYYRSNGTFCNISWGCFEDSCFGSLDYCKLLIPRITIFWAFNTCSHSERSIAIVTAWNPDRVWVTKQWNIINFNPPFSFSIWKFYSVDISLSRAVRLAIEFSLRSSILQMERLQCGIMLGMEALYNLPVAIFLLLKQATVFSLQLLDLISMTSFSFNNWATVVTTKFFDLLLVTTFFLKKWVTILSNHFCDSLFFCRQFDFMLQLFLLQNCCQVFCCISFDLGPLGFIFFVFVVQ